MRVAVIGGTGLVGRHTVGALRAKGHEPVVVSRGTGVDVTTGAGLADALDGVAAVVDVVSNESTDRVAAEQFFATETENLLVAEQRAGVGHHVLLSIVGIDRVEGNAHYAGKRVQEAMVTDGAIPWTIVAATEFFDFAGKVVDWTRTDAGAVVPPLLVQPVAVADVADLLAEVAVRKPLGRVVEIAGPETHDLVDMARRTLTARGDEVRLIARWQDSPFGVEMAGDVRLPGDDAHIAGTTFETWLEAQRG
ncbi:SDR family oxidoreductase [Asanoa iriomotensis]|uniref:LysR family transcriptional regulator n=1 Tax=Asanoa iriomotensis TaxID=234613 RepID=A0ABQ4C825_9ACTN|nr:SDR family oxidoreductase [Asanoa iriomotensis]GIF58601.1 LysR family transcriptional regulator [Asanoa iriomotensis]